MRHPLLERKINKSSQFHSSPANEIDESQHQETAEHLKPNDLHNFTPAGMLKLQRTLGNSAVMRLLEQRRADSSSKVVQRLPASAAVIAVAGRPKRNINTRFVKTNRSATYIKILDALDQYQPMVTATVNATVTAIDGQGINLVRKLTDIITDCDTYLGAHKADVRTQEIAKIKQQAAYERAFIRAASVSLQNKARQNTVLINTLPAPRPTWASLIHKDADPIDIDAGGGVQIGQGQGGINTVNSYQVGGRRGFFKPDKKQMDPSTKDEYGFDVISEEAGVANQLMGIPTNNPQFTNRSIAMYRLDQLLKANVLARTDFALKRNNAGQSELGSFMAMAPGQAASNQADQGRLVKNAQAKNQAATRGVAAMSLEDPAFQKALSKLTIVDALAGQFDRHQGNYFIDIDNGGNFRDLKGIDNDMSFPEHSIDLNSARMNKELKGIGKYIDKEIAEIILALQPEDLQAVLSGLIPDSAIGKTVERLTQLKALINQARAAGQLVDNLSNWTPQTAAAETPSNMYQARGYLGQWQASL